MGGIFDRSSEEKMPDNFAPLFNSISDEKKKLQAQKTPAKSREGIYDVESKEEELVEHGMRTGIKAGGKSECTDIVKNTIRGEVAKLQNRKLAMEGMHVTNENIENCYT